MQKIVLVSLFFCPLLGIILCPNIMADGTPGTTEEEIAVRWLNVIYIAQKDFLSDGKTDYNGDGIQDYARTFEELQPFLDKRLVEKGITSIYTISYANLRAEGLLFTLRIKRPDEDGGRPGFECVAVPEPEEPAKVATNRPQLQTLAIIAG